MTAGRNSIISAEQYEKIISLLVDKLEEKDTTIACQKWRIESLEKSLAEAEYHLNPHGEQPKTLEIR